MESASRLYEHPLYHYQCFSVYFPLLKDLSWYPGSEVIAILCGTFPEDEDKAKIVTSGNRLYLEFYSDNTWQFAGYEISWRRVEIATEGEQGKFL